jgi:hypothetical protein
MGPIVAGLLFFSPMLLIHAAASYMDKEAYETAIHCSNDRAPHAATAHRSRLSDARSPE